MVIITNRFKRIPRAVFNSFGFPRSIKFRWSALTFPYRIIRKVTLPIPEEENTHFRAMLKTLRLGNVSGLVRQFCYQSDISLKSLYPKSSLKITTPSVAVSISAYSSGKPSHVSLFQVSGDKFNGFIPVDKLDVTYSASSGPGGLNVNKVHTKCDVRFKVAEVTWLSTATKSKILQEYNHRLTKDGYYVVRSDLTRFRHMNLADALEKLRNFIRELEVEQKEPDVETVEKHKRR